MHKFRLIIYDWELFDKSEHFGSPKEKIIDKNGDVFIIEDYENS